MTSQPKDMEQLKKEIKDYIFLNEKGEIDLDLTVVVQRLLTRFSDKAHRSGRESMRDEFVEGADCPVSRCDCGNKRLTYTKHAVDCPYYIHQAISSALKKIKI